MNEIPFEIKEFIDKHNFNSSSCDGCNFCCCFQSGFAIKENVELIYKFYSEGKLERSDYKFKQNLDYDNFVRIYFDVIYHKAYNLLMYFPRHVAYDDVALIINPDENTDYWAHRNRILRDPINECKGCIFVENKMSLTDQKVRKCLLHTSEYNSKITTKPIDCVLLACGFNQRTKQLNQEDTHKYFLLLSKYYGEQKDVQQLVQPDIG